MFVCMYVCIHYMFVYMYMCIIYVCIMYVYNKYNKIYECICIQNHRSNLWNTIYVASGGASATQGSMESVVW